MIDLLLKKNYEVHGLYRKSSVGNTNNIDHLIVNNRIYNKRFFLHKGDLLDSVSLNNIINKINPKEIYNFADQDHVGWSYEIPSYSFRTTALSVIEILEIIRKKNKKLNFFNQFHLIFLVKQMKENKMKKLHQNRIVFTL